MGLKNIPVFDMGEYRKDKSAFAKAFGDAFQKYGLVRIKNHGIPKDVLEAADNVSKEFFTLPQEQKEKYCFPDANYQYGYVNGTEKQSGAAEADNKEHFMVRRPSKDDPTPEVSEVKNFNSAMQNLYKEFEELANEVLRPLSLHMGLDEEYFTGISKKSITSMRPIHYTEAGTAAPHLDMNFITFVRGKPGLFVLQPENDDRAQAGLQEENSKHAIAVECNDDEIIVNGGRQLALLTNNAYKPSLHWVETEKDRYTIVFFQHPDPDYTLDVLPPFKGQDNGLENEYWYKTMQEHLGEKPMPLSTEDFVNHRLKQNLHHDKKSAVSKPPKI